VTPDQLGKVAAAITAICWTFSAIAWTTAGREIGALPVGFIRLVMSCAPYLLSQLYLSGRPLPVDASARTWAVLGLSGLFSFFVSDICNFKAFLLVGPRIALLIQTLTPPAAALITWAMHGRLLESKDMVAMVLTLGGVVWVILERSPGDPKVHSTADRHLGIALAALGALAQAVALVLAREGMQNYPHKIPASFIRVIVALFGYLVLFTLTRRWRTIGFAIKNGRVLLILLAGACVGSFAGLVFSMVALARCPAGVVATILATIPVLILPFSTLFFGERVSLRAVGGALLALGGVALLMRGG
jgi:drug/metabolite transporter (DMT)-like permease